MADDSNRSHDVDALALALVVSSDAPILLIDGDLTVVAASASFSRAFQLDPAKVAGASIFALGQGEWDVRQLRSLLKATVSGAADIEAYEMDLARSGQSARRLVITAHQLDHGETARVLVLLTVSDVTDARLAQRLKDDLLREKAMLFQELQHRVANSLQIIASVLMQSARKSPSVETKGYLHDAHSRVMSVAALQKQLAASSVGEVELSSYFAELCESIGASMIVDHDALKLVVAADKTWTDSDISVSLGLIVTELVINALKHAFPDDRPGRIEVSYHIGESGWTLSVDDDGVGMPVGAEPAKAGLGTSIVHALARQLDAEVSVTALSPGTRVAIVGQPAAPGVTASGPVLAL